MHVRRVLALLVSLVGCATEPSPCSDAAAQLAGCTDDQRRSFVAACEETGGADPSSLLADTADECTPVPSDGKADGATLAVTGMCVAGMYGVRWTVTSLSAPGEPLSAETQAQLRPIYGDLVDRVTLTIGAALPPRIVIAGHELAVRPDAMTFNLHVMMLDEVASDKTRLLLTTVHELTHAQQSERAGGYWRFAVDYCRDMIAAGFHYDHIGMEIAAYAVEGDARRNLQRCGNVTCQ